MKLLTYITIYTLAQKSALVDELSCHIFKVQPPSFLIQEPTFIKFSIF